MHQRTLAKSYNIYLQTVSKLASSSVIALPLNKAAFFLTKLRNFSQLFKSFEFGNGSRMFDEDLVILEFKYLQKKL